MLQRGQAKQSKCWSNFVWPDLDAAFNSANWKCELFPETKVTIPSESWRQESHSQVMTKVKVWAVSITKKEKHQAKLTARSTTSDALQYQMDK